MFKQWTWNQEKSTKHWQDHVRWSFHEVPRIFPKRHSDIDGHGPSAGRSFSMPPSSQSCLVRCSPPSCDFHCANGVDSADTRKNIENEYSEMTCFPVDLVMAKQVFSDGSVWQLRDDRSGPAIYLASRFPVGGLKLGEAAQLGSLKKVGFGFQEALVGWWFHILGMS